MKDVWDARIRRAEELSSVYPFAAEGLRFYARIAGLQRNLYDEFERASAKSPVPPMPFLPGSLHRELNLPAIVSRLPGFLRMIETLAPMPLAQAAARLMQEGPAASQGRIAELWRELRAESARDRAEDELDITESYIAEKTLVWLFVQPYAEYLAKRHGPVCVEDTPSRCPLCGAKPIVGVLRPEGDGAKKSLICRLCGYEWAFRRIYCPACGEEREPLMAFYSAPEIAHVRVDVCETCRTYMKSVDLTKTGRAIPLIDELASLPLDLWARENGYRKLQINLLGI